MCLLLILSNKLDLNQETRFTILVYSTGFRITLPALTLKVKRRDFFYKNSKPRPSSAHAQLRSIQDNFKHTSWTNNKFSTSNKFNPSNQQSKATMTQLTWPDKFRPTPMSP